MSVLPSSREKTTKLYNRTRHHPKQTKRDREKKTYITTTEYHTIIGERKRKKKEEKNYRGAADSPVEKPAILALEQPGVGGDDVEARDGERRREVDAPDSVVREVQQDQDARARRVGCGVMAEIVEGGSGECVVGGGGGRWRECCDIVGR
eukprot:2552173-Rhodomonas_salina.4